MTAEEFTTGLEAVGLSQTAFIEEMKSRGVSLSSGYVSLWSTGGRPIPEKYVGAIKSIIQGRAVETITKATSVLQVA